MHICVFLFLIGSFLGFLASEFADRWGCSKRYRSSLPKKIFITATAGIAAAWLYWWEVEMQMLTPYCCPLNLREIPALYIIFVRDYMIHLVILTLLLAATLTDFYEMIIPDSITVTGTLFALLAAALFPLGGLPVTEFLGTDSFNPVAETNVYGIHVWSPYSTGMSSLLVMTLLWWFWCFAMLDRVWYTKLPFHKANAIFWRYLYRSPRTKYFIAAALLAPIGFACVFNIPLGDPIASGTALYSSLVGMATGMILVWGIRLVAQYVLGIEAMGFGDVTLMGMIGAFLGWQAVLLVFFAAPFFGLVYGIINLALGRGRAVPYGPFLCLATVVVVIAWSPIWAATAEYFAFGIEIIGLALLVLLVLFGGLLHVVHKIMGQRD